MIIIDWLKWSLIPNGIVCVEEAGKLSWFEAAKQLFSGGVARKPDGPSHLDMIGYAKMGLNVKRCKCGICRVYFWSWRKKRKVCHRWSCYRRRNETRRD